ncbi:MAG: PEP/pyruvate-binding domain-containing protein [Nanoarchaeota archaeon]
MVMKKEVKLDSGFIKWFSELRNKDVAIAGGKGASLAEMYANGFPVPPGFIVTAQAYTYFITQANLQGMIQGILERLQTEDTAALNNASKKIRALIEAAQLPPELEQELVEAYDILSVDKHDGGASDLLRGKKEGSYVAVRSSATTEDLADASFAGQQDSFLGVKGHELLIKKVKECFSSLFTARAIYYRVKKGFTRADSQLAVVVQRMINSEKSGVMFSRNPLVNDDSVIIEAVFGLGEGIVSGRILPDHYLINRNEEVIEMKVADKKIALVRGQNAEVDEVKLKEEVSKQQVLTGYELKRLAQYGMQLEEHYKKPQDIEFAIENGEIYIVQSRPITTKAKDTDKEIHGNVLLSGLGASPGISSGVVRIVRSMDDLAKVKSGEVLVTVMTNPDMVVSMQKAAGIVTDEGGVTCFAEETKVLTSRGFVTIKDAVELVASGQELWLLSYDALNLRPAWKRILSGAGRKRHAIRVSVSQKGTMDDNILDVTSDHKMIFFENRVLIKEQLSSVLEQEKCISVIDSLPATMATNDEKKAYVLGALASDGNIKVDLHHTGNPRRGRITFTQKQTDAKAAFIERVGLYFTECFGSSFKEPRLKESSGYLRERLVQGYASDYICNNLEIALKLKNIIHNLDSWVLTLDEPSCLNFLAGLIDGDGCLYDNRLHIYVGKEHVLQGVILACLRLGIFPQITRNRTIHHVQILERIDDIIQHTSRVKGEIRFKQQGNKLFSARAILLDIIDEVNYKGHIKPYVQNNCLIDSRKIASFVLPMTQAKERQQLLSVLSSGLRMQRVKKIADIGEIDVFNLEVEADNELDHNFVVFTSKYTPILVSNSHAAIVSREMGIPAVVGTRNATHKLKDGDIVTVDGNTGRVIEGKGIERKVEVNPIVPTRIKIKVIVDLPDYAPRAALSGAQSVGLVRLEGIIASHGKHPVWYLKNNKMRDYISVLSSGLKKIATPFKEIWVRTSDIRSDEYVGLEGAPQKKEGNPMLGNHGIRFSLMNVDLLEAELEAIKEIADEFSDKKFGVIMPQVISVDEVIKTKKIANEVKMPKNIVMGVMIETPAAVQIIEELCKQGIKFASFGTNDLTQYTLALDRNNEDMQGLYNEMHPAVLASIKQVIATCKRYGVETSICGQAGSREEMVRFLLKEGIDSISVNADAAQMVSKLVAGLEAKNMRVENNEEVKHRKRETREEYEINSSNVNKEIVTMAMNEQFNQKALDELFGIDKNVAQAMPVMKEEDLILKALDDDYSPNLKGKSDIPSLNDAIPVNSEFFDK